MPAHVVDVSGANFEQVVLEGSKKAPVLVDFRAPWCALCRALTPILEKLAEEYGGRFKLAKVNSDENQALAAQFGVRGIPNVKAFVKGELADEFAGALPEPLVREFIDRAIPSPSEELRQQATEGYRQSGNGPEALALLARAVELDPQNQAARADSADICLDLGRLGDARKLLDSLSGIAQMSDRVMVSRERLALAEGAARAGDLDALKARVAANAGDLDARLQLANLYVARNEYRSALDQLLDIVRRDRKFKDDIGRRTMLEVFTLLGPHELVDEYRRRLASAMY